MAHIWQAGSLALEGHAAAAYDIAAHHDRERAMFGADTPYYGWLYPPILVFVASPLALLPYPLALAVFQGAVTALAICGTAWAWHSPHSREFGSATLAAATALASPHLLDDDLVLLGPSMAFLVAAMCDDRVRDYDISVSAFVWISPLFAQSVAGLSDAPVALVATLTLFSLIMRRASERTDHAAAPA